MTIRSLWALPLALATTIQPVRAQLEPAQPPVRQTLSETGAAVEPRTFSQSLDDLVREGVVKPEEVERFRSTSPLIDGGALQRACRSGALSPAECKNGITIHWHPLPTTTTNRTTTTTPPAAKPQGSAARPAGVVLISGCIHTPFKPQGEGQLVSTYSCANSDVVGYSIAVDCARQLTSIYGPKTGINDSYSWGAWVEPGDAHQQAAMDAACAPLFKAAGQGVR